MKQQIDWPAAGDVLEVGCGPGWLWADGAGLPAGGALTPVPFGILIDHGHAGLILILAAGLLLLSLACMGTAEASARQRSTAAPAAAE